MTINPKDTNFDALPSAYDAANADRFEAKINRNPTFNMADTPTRVTAEWGNESDGTLRSMQARSSLAFRNVREDGVVGDGATNDDAALATAFGNGAGSYFMPPGTYLVTGDVTVTAGSVVIAAGVTMSGGALVSAGAFTVLGVGAGVIDTESITLDSGPTIGSVTGTPEGAVAAPVGSLRLRTDGTANATFYRKESGTGNTGWVAVSNEALTFRSGANSPLGSITPNYVGEEYLETTSETWWKAYGVAANTEWEPITVGQGQTLTDSATPSVANGSLFLVGGPTTITDFSDPKTGKVIHVAALLSVIVENNTNILLGGGADYAMASGDTLTLVYFVGRWFEVGRAGLPPISTGSTFDNSGTPSAQGDSLWLTGGTTTITDFDDQTVGQVIQILSNHNVTIQNASGVINLKGSVDFDMVPQDTLTLVYFIGRWNELARTVRAATLVGDVTSSISSSTSGRVAIFNDTSGKLITESDAVLHAQIMLLDGSRSFSGQVSGVTGTTTARLATFGQIVGPGVSAMGTGNSPSTTLTRVGTFPASGTNLTTLASGAVAGQRFTYIATGARILEHSTLLQLHGDRDFPIESGDTLSLVFDGTNWIETGRTQRNLFVTLSADQATYNVSGVEYVKLANAATDVTDFTNGIETQRLTIVATGARVVVDSSNIQLNGATDFSMSNSDSLSLVHDGSNWIETSRSDTS